MKTDEHFIRLTLDIAKQARAGGNHPFGAILVGPDGSVLMEAGNATETPGDRTGHAERVLMTRASLAYSTEFLAGCTMYTSAEPCAMCAGSAYWAGVGRVVYGLSEREMGKIIGPHPENLTMDLPYRPRRRATPHRSGRSPARGRIAGSARWILAVVTLGAPIASPLIGF